MDDADLPVHVVVLTAAAKSSVLLIDVSGVQIAGRWMGADPVAAGQIVNVELDLGRPRAWGEIAAAGGRRAVGQDVLCGTVEFVYDDGMVVIRVGDLTALLELDGVVPADPVGKVVWIPVGDIAFFPTGV